jgi:hypothetical protein
LAWHHENHHSKGWVDRRRRSSLRQINDHFQMNCQIVALSRSILPHSSKVLARGTAITRLLTGPAGFQPFRNMRHSGLFVVEAHIAPPRGGRARRVPPASWMEHDRSTRKSKSPGPFAGDPGSWPCRGMECGQLAAVAEERNFIGSSAVAPFRTSKCSCGLETEPVWPALAITSPRFTVSPRFTNNSLAWA